MLYSYTNSEYVETYGYPYYFFCRFSAGGYVYEERYYTTEKFRVDYQQDNKVAISFRSEWVDGRRMAYYLQSYRNGILVDERTVVSMSGMTRGPLDNFEILGANYYVTLLDGVTVVYSPPRKKEPMNWLKIYNPNLTLLAVVAKAIKPTITEELNGAYTFDFSYVIDDEKSQYMQVGNIVEVENNYFRICYTEESRNADDTLTISVSCEHIVYDLIEHELDYYTADGTATQMLETLLSDTDFTVGDVDTSEVKTVSIQEKQNKKDILYAIASVFGLELKFEKFKINLVKRGSDNGVQFRYRRNIKGITRIVDGRNKVDGQPSIAYGLDAVMLEQLFGDSEHFELGDTVRVYDEGLGIDVTTRIVKMSYDIEERMTADVEIANYIPNITDTLTQIERTTVHKEKIYNGVKIGPDDGIVVERSDKLARNTMNATYGNLLEVGDGEGNYTPVFYVAVDPEDGKAKLYLAGNAVFTGLIETSDMVGGSINIGEGTFEVNEDGKVVIKSADVTITRADGKARVVISEASGMSFQKYNETTQEWEDTIALDANGEGVIIGGTIKTAKDGARIEISNNQIRSYNDYGELHGLSTNNSTEQFGDWEFYDNGKLVFRVYNATGGQGVTLLPGDETSLIVGSHGNVLGLRGYMSINGNAIPSFDEKSASSSYGANEQEMLQEVHDMLRQLLDAINDN